MCISRAAVFNGVLSVLERDLPYRANVFGTHDSELRGFYSVGSFSDSGWAREGEFSWRPLPVDRLSLDMRYTRSKFRHPLIFLRDNVMGKIWYAQLAHSRLPLHPRQSGLFRECEALGLAYCRDNIA
ncbi:MAG: hypothetical protein IKA64_03375 [Clostridia bacterium]|nr:hypothetical protein [Clostridia bacterium]